jgi:hypothetical protein
MKAPRAANPNILGDHLKEGDVRCATMAAVNLGRYRDEAKLQAIVFARFWEHILQSQPILRGIPLDDEQFNWEVIAACLLHQAILKKPHPIQDVPPMVVVP